MTLMKATLNITTERTLKSVFFMTTGKIGIMQLQTKKFSKRKSIQSNRSKKLSNHSN